MEGDGSPPARVIVRPRRLKRWYPVPRKGASSTPSRRPIAADDDIERVRQTERARFAAQLDGELLVACRSEAAARRHIGELARRLLRERSYQRLGFARLSDYARERLGLSARTVESAAWVVERLERLPLIAAAFDRAEISWACARALCSLAFAADERAWLERARHLTVAELEELAEARCPQPADPDADDALIDDEPALRLRIATSARVRALWRRALELASRVAGEVLARWRAAEAIAAEALSGRPPNARIADRAIVEGVRRTARERRRAAAARDARDARDRPTDCAPTPSGDARAGVLGGPEHAIRPEHAIAIAPPVTPAVSVAAASMDSGTAAFTGAPADPFALDAQLRFAAQAIHTSGPRIGRLLRVMIDQKFYRTVGFRSVDAYVRERLGISARTAWALVKVEKSTWRAGEFQRAYYDGSLSWCRALTLLPVLDRMNAAAWIERAESVTVRRLTDEVNHVLEARDVFGDDLPLDPPSVDDPLPSPVAQALASDGRRTQRDADAQICAHATPEALRKLAARGRAQSQICDTEVAFTGPASVVALFRDALDAFSDPGDPRSLALERVLRHAIATWEALPRHPDPIFARDGWRCTVPGCSGRRNLHDHHLLWRSQGGGNAQDNRTPVCAGHHLHGIHRHTIRAWGEAPHAIRWELGIRPNGPPLVSYVGDRICVSSR